MENRPEDRIKLDGEPVAELLDHGEYHSNLGNVAAISDRQICFLRRDWHELTHFKLEYFDVRDCRAIEYQKEIAYYRILAGAACFIAAVIFVFMLVTDLEGISAESGPLIIAVIALVSLGGRFINTKQRQKHRF